jgi:hypothetical protein
MGVPCFTVVVKPLSAFCTISTVLFNCPVSLLTPNRGSRQNYFPDIKTACSNHKSIGLCRHDAGPAQVAGYCRVGRILWLHRSQLNFSFIKVNLPEQITRYQRQFYNSGILYPDLADSVSKPFN